MASYQDRVTVMMGFAESFATLSTCERGKVGCVICTADAKHVISHGFNGAPPGFPHCAEVGCAVEEVGDRQHCVRATHAEENALLWAARIGRSVQGALLLCTHAPCRTCARMIVTAGILEVIYLDPYHDSGVHILKEGGLMVSRIYPL